MRSKPKDRPDTINPCSACGKPDGETHRRWCGVKTQRYERRVYPRINLDGSVDHICSHCLALVLHPEHICERCTTVDLARRQAASAFFAEQKAKKQQEKLEAQLLADEAAELI